MIPIIIDGILHEVWGDRVLWDSPTTGELVVAPANWATIARALVLCDYEDKDGHTYVAGVQLYEHLVDTHDRDGREVPGGRPSHLHFPLKSGMPPIRASKVQTGTMDGHRMVTVLAWDDPLNAVVTTTEAEARFGLAEGSAKKAAQRGQIAARKTGKVWLLRSSDAARMWG